MSVLKYAGKRKRAQLDMSDEEVGPWSVVSIHSPGLLPPLLLVQVVLLAIMDMNMARLTAADIPLFNGFTADLFQGVEVHYLCLTMER